MSSAEREANHRRSTRSEELAVVETVLGREIDGRDLLEIGAGDGAQLSELAKRCRSAKGIDLADSPYAGPRPAHIGTSDGLPLPFADSTFDVVFSSNVLERVAHLDEIQSEIRRVLRPGGIAIHIVPTQHWRLWTSLSHYFTLLRDHPFARQGCRSPRATVRVIADALVCPRHGARGSRFSEYSYFKPSWWSHRFRAGGWTEVLSCPIGIFYTGHRLFGDALDMKTRRALARRLGSSTHLFALRVRKQLSGLALANPAQYRQNMIQAAASTRPSMRKMPRATCPPPRLHH
jgi:ubiquinone/menaquinone biosynthesis C-methylase UbiE